MVAKVSDFFFQKNRQNQRESQEPEECQKNTNADFVGTKENNYSISIWLSGWWFQIFYMFTPIWGRFPIWRAYFSNGLVQPPTSYSRVKKVDRKLANCASNWLLSPQKWCFSKGTQNWSTNIWVAGRYLKTPKTPNFRWYLGDNLSFVESGDCEMTCCQSQFPASKIPTWHATNLQKDPTEGSNKDPNHHAPPQLCKYLQSPDVFLVFCRVSWVQFSPVKNDIMPPWLYLAYP